MTQRSLLALIVAAIVLAGASVVVASTLGGAGDNGGEPSHAQRLDHERPRHE